MIKKIVQGREKKKGKGSKDIRKFWEVDRLSGILQRYHSGGEQDREKT